MVRGPYRVRCSHRRITASRPRSGRRGSVHRRPLAPGTRPDSSRRARSRRRQCSGDLSQWHAGNHRRDSVGARRRLGPGGVAPRQLAARSGSQTIRRGAGHPSRVRRPRQARPSHPIRKRRVPRRIVRPVAHTRPASSAARRPTGGVRAGSSHIARRCPRPLAGRTRTGRRRRPRPVVHRARRLERLAASDRPGRLRGAALHVARRDRGVGAGDRAGRARARRACRRTRASRRRTRSRTGRRIHRQSSS